jgi:peroxiredoxin
MAALTAGTKAPPIHGVEFDNAPLTLFFYKVTCPVCQMAAPKVETFERAYPGRIVGIGQDPAEKLDAFGRSFGLDIPTVADALPYDASEAYGIEVVPTTFLVGDDGTILDAVESWDREGLNRLSQRLASLAGRPYAPISEVDDGLPIFRPG